MQILPAKPEDAERVTAIAFAAKQHWGYPDHWMEEWRTALTLTPGFIASHDTFVAMVDDEPVGFYALGQNDGRLDLLHLWVLPACMGRGIGRSLFYHAVERAKVLGFRELEIESDPNAEGFYQHLGACKISVRIGAVAQERRELPILVYEINHHSGSRNKFPEGKQHGMRMERE